jgi:hypothetical protein
MTSSVVRTADLVADSQILVFRTEPVNGIVAR